MHPHTAMAIEGRLSRVDWRGEARAPRGGQVRDAMGVERAAAKVGSNGELHANVSC